MTETLYYILWVGGTIILTIVLMKVVSVITKRSFARAAEKLNMDPTNYSFLKNAINFIVILMATVLLFNKIPALKSIGNTVLAGAGILAAAIGFASQQAFANIISGIFMIIFKPFRVGDFIQANTNTGWVEEITLRHTIIRSPENRRIIVPNSIMSSETIVNSSYNDEDIKVFIEVGISYHSDIDKAIQILREEAEKHPDMIDKRTKQEKKSGESPIWVKVIQLAESSVIIRAIVWGKDQPSAFNLKCDILKSTKERFDKESIEIPFPYHNVIIKQQ